VNASASSDYDDLEWKARTTPLGISFFHFRCSSRKNIRSPWCCVHFKLNVFIICTTGSSMQFTRFFLLAHTTIILMLHMPA
jgi:hypothetical protein